MAQINGAFRKKTGYAATSNEVLRNPNLTLKEKGLYGLIQSWITLDNIVLTKDFLKRFCTEGEQAFETAWNGLKEHGYIKIHAFQAEHGRYRYVYELLDAEDLRDGVYLYRYDKNNRLSTTNLGPATPEQIKQMEQNWQSNDHTPKNCPDGVSDQYPEKYPDGKDRYGRNCGGEHSCKKRGCKITLYSKPENKPENNPTINPAEQDIAAPEQVKQEVMTSQTIPYHYASQPEKMRTAIQMLTDYDFRQQHPYSQNGSTDEARQNAYDLLVPTLVEMATDPQLKEYHGSLVTRDQVIEKLNRACTDWDTGGLEEFTECALDEFMEAASTRKVKNVGNYLKSLLWSTLSTFRVKQDAQVSWMTHEKSRTQTEQYGCSRQLRY